MPPYTLLTTLSASRDDVEYRDTSTGAHPTRRPSVAKAAGE
ncbi:hypothetical protein [Dactylosporangium sp. CA-139066]